MSHARNLIEPKDSKPIRLVASSSELMRAIKSRDQKQVRTILKHINKEELNQPDPNNDTPLYAALDLRIATKAENDAKKKEQQLKEIDAIILQLLATKDINLYAKKGTHSIFELFARAYKDFPIDSYKEHINQIIVSSKKDAMVDLFHQAIYAHNLELVKYLVSLDKNLLAQKNSKGFSPYMIALAASAVEVESYFYSLKAQDEKIELETKLNLPLAPNYSAPEILKAACFYENNTDRQKIEKIIDELYANPEFRPTLEIVALSCLSERDALNKALRIFVAHGDHIQSLTPKSSGHGDLDLEAGILRFGAGRNEEILKGTLIHELTHLAALATFGNEAKPFAEDSQEAQAHHHAVQQLQQIKQKYKPLGVIDEKCSELVVGRIEKYRLREKQSELKKGSLSTPEWIASIPQAIVLYGKYNESKGRSLLEGRAGPMLSFWRNQFNSKVKEAIAKHPDKEKLKIPAVPPVADAPESVILFTSIKKLKNVLLTPHYEDEKGEKYDPKLSRIIHQFLMGKAFNQAIADKTKEMKDVDVDNLEIDLGQAKALIDITYSKAYKLHFNAVYRHIQTIKQPLESYLQENFREMHPQINSLISDWASTVRLHEPAKKTEFIYEFPGQHYWTVKGLTSCVPIALMATAELLALSDDKFFRVFDPNFDSKEAKATLFQWVKQGIRFNSEISPDIKSNLFVGPLKEIMPKSIEDLLDAAEKTKESPWYHLDHVQNLKVLHSDYKVAKDNLETYCKNLIKTYKRRGFNLNDLAFLAGGGGHQTMFFAKQFPDGHIYYYVFDSAPSRAVGGEFKGGSMEVYSDLKSAVEAIQLRWKGDAVGDIVLTTTQDKFLKVQDYIPLSQLELTLKMDQKSTTLQSNQELLAQIFYHLKPEKKLDEKKEETLIKKMESTGKNYVEQINTERRACKKNLSLPRSIKKLEDLERKNLELLRKIEALYQLRRDEVPQNKLLISAVEKLKTDLESFVNKCRATLEFHEITSEQNNAEHDRQFLLELCVVIRENLHQIRAQQENKSQETQDVYETILVQLTKFQSGLLANTITPTEVLYGLKELSDARQFFGLSPMFTSTFSAPIKRNLNFLKNREYRELAQELFTNVCLEDTIERRPPLRKHGSTEIIPHSLQAVLIRELKNSNLSETKSIPAMIKIAKALSLKEQCFFVTELIELMPNPDKYQAFQIQIQTNYDAYLAQQLIVDKYIKKQIKLRDEILKCEALYKRIPTPEILKKIAQAKAKLKEINLKYHAAYKKLKQIEKISAPLTNIYALLAEEEIILHSDKVQSLIHALCQSSAAEELLSIQYLLYPNAEHNPITVTLLNNRLRSKKPKNLLSFKSNDIITAHHILNYITGKINPNQELKFEQLERIADDLSKGQLVKAIKNLQKISGLEDIAVNFIEARVCISGKMMGLNAALLDSKEESKEETRGEVKAELDETPLEEKEIEYKMSLQIRNFIERGGLHKLILNFNHIRIYRLRQITQPEEYADEVWDAYKNRLQQSYVFSSDDVLLIKQMLQDIYKQVPDIQNKIAELIILDEKEQKSPFNFQGSSHQVLADKKLLSNVCSSKLDLINHEIGNLCWGEAVGHVIKKYYKTPSAIAERLPAFVDAEVMKDKKIISAHLGQSFEIRLNQQNTLHVVTQNLSIHGLRDFAGQQYIETLDNLKQRLLSIREKFSRVKFDIQLLQGIDFQSIAKLGYPEDYEGDKKNEDVFNQFKAWIKLPEKFKLIGNPKYGLVTIYDSEKLELIPNAEQKMESKTTTKLTPLNGPEGILRTKFKHKNSNQMVICHNIQGQMALDPKKHEDAIKALHQLEVQEAKAVILSGGNFNAPISPIKPVYRDSSTACSPPNRFDETTGSGTGLFYSTSDEPLSIKQSPAGCLAYQKTKLLLDPIPIDPIEDPLFLQGPYKTVMFSENHIIHHFEVRKLEEKLREKNPSISVLVQKNRYNAYRLVIQCDRVNSDLHKLKDTEYKIQNGKHQYILKPLENARHQLYLNKLFYSINQNYMDRGKQVILNKLLKQIFLLSKKKDALSKKKAECLNKVYKKLLYFTRHDNYEACQALQQTLRDLARDDNVKSFNRVLSYIGAMMWQRSKRPTSEASRLILEAVEYLENQFIDAHRHQIRRSVNTL